jgi:tRNA acetyltransferase TAN1
MKSDVNLLVTYEPINQFIARDEVEQVLREIGDITPEFMHSRVRGLFMIHVDRDPKAVTTQLDALCRREPSMFWYTYHWIPVEQWCPATIAAMSEVVKELAKRIRPEERWRMRINKRFYQQYHTRDLIEHLAQLVNRSHVDLEHPEKIIRIELIRGRAGVSLLTAQEEFSVNRVKNEMLTS